MSGATDPSPFPGTDDSAADGDEREDGPPVRPGAEAAEREARRRRRAAVFGDVLPEATRDDRGDGWGERGDGGSGDDWLRRQVPPHHG